MILTRVFWFVRYYAFINLPIKFTSYFENTNTKVNFNRNFSEIINLFNIYKQRINYSASNLSIITQFAKFLTNKFILNTKTV